MDKRDELEEGVKMTDRMLTCAAEWMVVPVPQSPINEWDSCALGYKRHLRWVSVIIEEDKKLWCLTQLSGRDGLFDWASWWQGHD